MLTIRRRMFPSPAVAPGLSMRSDQLLRAMHKVLSHDLPNQMVVLQSLLQLLDADEAARLSPQGQEFVQRLQGATRRAGDMVRFLKEMSRLNEYTCRLETVALAGLTRELQGELLRRHPHSPFEFAQRFETPAVRIDPRVLLQALLELFAGLVATRGDGAADACLVTLRSELLADGVELAFDVPTATPRQALKQRLEYLLARAWLALGGVRVAVTQPAPAQLRFAINIPDRAT